MSLSRLKTASAYPPKDLMWLAVSESISVGGRLRWRIRDRWGGGAVKTRDTVPDIDVGYCPALRREVSEVERILRQRRCLPGAGWVGVGYGDEAPGIWGTRYDHRPTWVLDNGRPESWMGELLHPRHAARGRKLWTLIEPPYDPVDWQRDPRSGFRWSERTWFRSIDFGHVRGADIRVAWEHGRLQHLPPLALSANPDDSTGERIVRHVENELVDFAALNPVGWGVHWGSAMEVGLRAVSILLARDLLHAKGLTFRPAVRQVLRTTLYEHAVFLLANLSWAPNRRNNHYLVEVVTLLVVAAYLEGTPETNAWLQVAAAEFLEELDYQFNEDGSNFEGSTAYHLFTAEAVAVGTAFARAVVRREGHRLGEETDLSVLPAALRIRLGGRHVDDVRERDGWPEYLYARCEGLRGFVEGITKPDGTVPLIGDNDSGRIFRFSGISEETDGPDARESTDPLKAGLLVTQVHEVTEALRAVGREDAPAGEPSGSMAGPILAAIGGREVGGSTGTGSSVRVRLGPARDDPSITWEVRTVVPGRRVVTDVSSEGSSLREDVTLRRFDDFGLLVLASTQVYMTLRVGPGRRAFAPTAHRHNDALSSELVIRGTSVVRDPGSAAYTGFPDVRNMYRSSAVHWSPVHRPASERRSLGQGLFINRWEHRVVVERADCEGLSASCEYPEGRVRRSIYLKEDRVRFVDELDPVSLAGCHFPPGMLYSPVYGRVDAGGRSALTVRL